MTSISADTHKYGYAFKGSSVLSFRSKALRNAQYFYLTDWSGGKYTSPGMEGSRSGGLIAATWAAMVQLGHAGYLGYARQIFETSFAMQEAVTAHPELRLVGRPTFLFSFTSDEFDIYHVNDFMRTRGWRFNGQQYPNALHMAVTRPQTQPEVVAAFAADLADAVAYAKEHAAEAPRSGAIYGGVAGGMTEEADEFIRAVMADMLDGQSTHPGDVSDATAGAPDRLGGRVHRGPGRAGRRPGGADRRGGPRAEPAARLERRARADAPRRATRTAWSGGSRARRAGELRDQYPGGLDQRRADIEAGAGRPAAELVADVRRSSAAVERVMAALPAAAWDAPARTSRGVVETSRDAVLSRWREVVVHHGDLGLCGPVPLRPTWSTPGCRASCRGWRSGPTRPRCWPGSSGGATRPSWPPGSAPARVSAETKAFPARSTATQ